MHKSTIALSLLLVASNGWWVYRAIDQAITKAYADQQSDAANRRVAALSKLASSTLRGTPKSEAMAMLRTLSTDSEPYEKDGALHTGWLTLPIDADGRVSEVRAE